MLNLCKIFIATQFLDFAIFQVFKGLRWANILNLSKILEFLNFAKFQVLQDRGGQKS